MQIPEKLMRYLNDKNVTYEILHHPEAFTAQTIAAAEHIKGRHHARVVMVTSGGEHLMTVLPADRKVGILRFAMALDRGANLRMAGQLPSPRSGLRDQSTHERGLDQNRHDPPYGAKARLKTRGWRLDGLCLRATAPRPPRHGGDPAQSAGGNRNPTRVRRANLRRYLFDEGRLYCF